MPSIYMYVVTFQYASPSLPILPLALQNQMLGGRLSRLAQGLVRRQLPPPRRSIQCYSGEEGAYSTSGALMPKPLKMQFGVVRALATVLPFLYLGATISKEGAAFLEENDIFVPDDDD